MRLPIKDDIGDGGSAFIEGTRDISNGDGGTTCIGYVKPSSEGMGGIKDRTEIGDGGTLF
jgi:hypothetical protein